MSYIETLQERFPVRKSRAQKEAFRTWAVSEASYLGYEASIVGKTSKNVVIGDADKAQVIFTAHYDTPPTMPIPNFITPCNVGIYMLYQLALVLGMMLICSILAVPVGLASGLDAAFVAWELCLVALLLLLFFGPANPHNANDNTSGVASVLETMARVPKDKRDKVAFILFDNEEKGMLGSNGFASKHKQLQKETLLVNMDCVGVGETILFFSPKKARQHEKFDLLQRSINAQEGRQVEWFNMEGHMYPSDQSNFKCGIAVCACKKGKRVGYYYSKIHTKHDTVADAGNIAFIADGLAAMTKELS